MKERTSNLSLTALAAGIMAIITVFGGYTAFLGVFFAFFSILAAARGRRQQRTRLADWAMAISVFALILCTVIIAVYILLYFTSQIDLNIDLYGIYEKGKELLIRIINHF